MDLDEPPRPRTKRERYNEQGITERQALAQFAVLMLTLGYGGLKLAVPVVALFQGHWQFAVLLGLTLFSAKRYHGFLVVNYVMDVAVFAVGLAVGLPGLAFSGVLLPETLRLILIFGFAERFGVRIRFLRVDHPPLEDEAKRLEIRRNKLSQWRERIQAAPADRKALEQALFDMRDWRMTPSQAIRVACRAGAPRELVEEIVNDVVLWPHLEERRYVEAGWKWERTIDQKGS